MPGESWGSFVYAGASGYRRIACGETLACGGLAPQLFLSLQKQILPSNTSKEKAGLSLWVAEADLEPGTRLQVPGTHYLDSSDVSSIKLYECRTSLMVQWLRIHLPMQRTQVQSLVGELRPHVLQDS